MLKVDKLNGFIYNIGTQKEGEYIDMDSMYKEENDYLQKVNEVLKEELAEMKKLLQSVAEKKVTFDDAKRGEQFVKADLMHNYNERIHRLINVASSPYFGRMDFRQDGNFEAEKIYIGRISLEKNGKMVVIDWRTPIASMYYNSSSGKAQYDAPQGIVKGNVDLKRQIIIDDYKIKNILDTDIVTNDEILQEYLNVHADEKMKNIIASIQEEQNTIIRKPLDTNIIVQGVAGSGKTSVALHRIAYLLYNAKNTVKNNQFLLLGPNNYFLDYISSVLPELESEPIKQKRYLDFTCDYIEEKLSLSNSEYKPKNKNEQGLFEKVKKLKNSLQYKEAIEMFMNDYLNCSFIDSGIIIDGVEIFDKEFISKALLSGIISNLSFERAKNITINKFNDNKDRIYASLKKKYQAVYMALDASEKEKDEARAKATKLYDLIYKKGEKIIKDYYKKLDMKVSDIYVRYINNCEKYLKNINNDEIEMLKRVSLNNSGKKRLCNEDLPALNYIKYLLSSKETDYKQIAIDEAQDYGLFHYYTLVKTSPQARFSIYGDLAQSISSAANIKDWNEVVNKIFNGNCEILQLDKSYRTTKEITNNANLVLDNLLLSTANSVERHGKEVEYYKVKNSESELRDIITEWINNDYQSIGIICKTEKEALKLYKELIKNKIPVNYLDDAHSKYEGGIYVTTSMASKGLEFDAVVINNASEEIYDSSNSMDMHLLYVALTRALHELKILYTKDITKALSTRVRKKAR